MSPLGAKGSLPPYRGKQSLALWVRIFTASIGDLNGDGKLDVVSSGRWINWNNSTPGSFSFTVEDIREDGTTSSQFSSLGDLNGDGLLDLACPEGIYFNTGTSQTPAFDFENVSPWNKTGGLSWRATSDSPPHVFLKDVDGDGLVDAYVSNIPTTVWQALFYKNTGTDASHHMEYMGPVVASSSPLNVSRLGDTTPHFGVGSADLAAGDIDDNGLPDVLVSAYPSAIVWNFPGTAGDSSHPTLSYPDLYTYPELDRVNYYCGLDWWAKEDGEIDPLCLPPYPFSAWTDLTGDGQPDALRAELNVYRDGFNFYTQTRDGSWPFTLGEDSAIRTTPSGTQATGYGVAMVDVNLDGRLDMVTGAEDGTLLCYLDTATSGAAIFADAVLLADSSGTAIDVGEQSWLTAIDLDGDGDMDLLVANYEDHAKSEIRKIICVTPGSTQGYETGGLIGTPEQDPIDLIHVTGGGVLVPSIAAIDVDGDGLKDVMVGDSDGKVWLLKNIGAASEASFNLQPLLVSGTNAAYMEILNSKQLRLYFALPTIDRPTNLEFHDITTREGSTISGQTPVLLTNDTDSDGDGFADYEDICSGHDDNVDLDIDGIPDGCDDLIDSNGDGIPDSEDNDSTQTTNLGFESGRLSSSWITGGDGIWPVTANKSYSGTYSLEAPLRIGRDQSAYVEITLDCSDGNVTFWYSVNSLSGWDYLEFYIDGVEIEGWSGSIDWTQATFAVPAGIHTFRWAYIKRGPDNSFSDTAWIDEIQLPGTTQPTQQDSDGDGIDDTEDQCPGYDDRIDEDNDGTPDGCDALTDSDGDGVSDDNDQCSGYDDTIDVDSDGIPDGCDALIDSDSDGVAESVDICPGHDDNVDSDNDGTPDGCDDSTQTSKQGFDYLAYLSANPDLPSNWGKAECMNHYKLYGFAENRAVTFNLQEYLNANPDFPTNWTLAEGLNHYNMYGKFENRLLAFDAQEYLSLYPDLPQSWSYDQAYAHYVNYGSNEGRIASFDETAYLELYSDLPSSWGQDEAFYHYIYFGKYEGRVYDPYDEDVFAN